MEKVKVSFDVPKCYLERFKSLVSMSGTDLDVFYSFLVYYACYDKRVYDDFINALVVRDILDVLSDK